MVAAAARRRADGLVPFDPVRHLGPVSELISLTFGNELGPEARHILRRMRRLARWGGLALFLWEAEAGALGAPGFVWLEGNQVIGNVSLRRAASPGGWMIGNVAVHPDRQRRGIGRTLMEAAVQSATQRGGDWVGLEVREDNTTARGLYERMGFELVGTMLELARPAGLPWQPLPPVPPWLRQARATDGRTLYQLAQEGLSRPHMDVLEVRRSAYRAGWEVRLAAWLEARRENAWVAEDGGHVVGALRLTSRWSARWHKIEVLVLQERLGDLGPRLAAAGLALLSRRRPWEAATTLPAPRESLEPLFTDAGFRRTRRLAQMQLRLGGRA